MIRIRFLGVAAVFAVLVPNMTIADPLPASDVQAFFAAGKFRATAGSTFEFKRDGTFRITHSNGSESGTWTVAEDGTITRLRSDASKPDVFFIDMNAKGKRTIVYTSGQYRGQKFTLR